MAFRTFTDSEGRDWQVYDVTPPADERRRYDRRATPDAVEPERRESDDRRLTVGRVSRLAAAAPEGWLCFQLGEERRRLSPIPKEWTRAGDRELEEYSRIARPAPTTSVNAESPDARQR